MNRIHVAALLVSTLVLAAASAESTATLRNGSRVEITDVSSAGISIPPDAGRPARLLPLSLVRSVDGELAPKFEANRALAGDLWRAGARLARHDYAGADPILERLWKATSGASGPTRAEISAGLLACRISRGAFASALEPWTEWIDESVTLDTENAARVRSMVEMLEPGDIWIASMPPIWVDAPAVREIAAASLPAPNPKDVGHPTGADVREIYSVAARRDTGASWNIDPASAMKNAGWANLAGEMVLAEATEPAIRTEARQRLSSRLASDGASWKQAWIRLALGRSLLLETSLDDRRSGVLNLLWVASRAEVAPTVVAIALADAARGLVSLGDAPGAASVLADLERRFPDDPILESAQLANARKAIGTQRQQPSSGTTTAQSQPAPAKAAEENQK